MPQIAADLTKHEQMWMTRALLDDGYRWEQIVAAMSPPYEMEQIEAWLIEADAQGAMSDHGNGYEPTEPDHLAQVYQQARGQQAADPAEVEECQS